MTTNSLFEDLVLSMFSVNNYPLTKMWAHRDSLRTEGVFDPQKVASWSVEEAITHMNIAGFDRGGYNPFLADRLLELAQQVKDGGLLQLEKLLGAGDVAAVESYLISIRGVGPAVIRNFWVLQDREDLALT